MAFNENVFTFIINSIGKQDTREILARLLHELQLVHRHIGTKMYELADILSSKSGLKTYFIRSLGVPKNIVDKLDDLTIEKLIPLLIGLYKKKATKEGFLGFLRSFLRGDVAYDEVYDFWWLLTDKALADENYVVSDTDLKTATLYLRNYMYQTLSSRILRDTAGIFRCIVENGHQHLVTANLLLLYDIKSHNTGVAGVSLKVDGFWTDRSMSYTPVQAEEWTSVEIPLSFLIRGGRATSTIDGGGGTSTLVATEESFIPEDVGKSITFKGVSYDILAYTDEYTLTLDGEVAETDETWDIPVYITDVAIFDNYEDVNTVSIRNVILLELATGKSTPLFSYKDNFKAIPDYVTSMRYWSETDSAYSNTPSATDVATGDRVIFCLESPLRKFSFTIDTPLTNASTLVKYYDTEAEDWVEVDTITGEYYLWDTAQNIEFTLPDGAEWGSTTIDGATGYFLCLEVVDFTATEKLPAVTAFSLPDNNFQWTLWSGITYSIDNDLVKDVVNFTRPLGTRVEIYNVTSKYDYFSELTDGLYWSPTAYPEEGKLVVPREFGVEQIILPGDTLKLLGIKDTGLSILTEIDDPTALITINIAKASSNDYYSVLFDVANNIISAYKYSGGVRYDVTQVENLFKGDRFRLEVVKDMLNLLVSVDGSTVINVPCERTSGYWEVLGGGFTLADLVAFEVPSNMEVV